MAKVITSSAALLLFSVIMTSGQANGQANFNSYILKSVEKIAKTRSRLGYDNYSYTQDLTFGDAGTLSATAPPMTMCVAAQMEVFVEALNVYAKETKDYKPFHYIPKSSWERLGPLDLRGQIWIVKNAPSRGASDAFANFGMGDKISFDHLTPGSFLNLNRSTTGHGVIFLSYLDRSGQELPNYSEAVAGFKYFSAQGPRGSGQGGGFDYRWAFFNDAGCPSLDPSKKRDCGIIRSTDRKLLNTGTLRMPEKWDRAKAMDQITQAGQAAQLGNDELLKEGELDVNFFTGQTTDD
jgi:hypothetical protein